jgi:pimeloyl-ACP methyl ester carboxylesterase
MGTSGGVKELEGTVGGNLDQSSVVQAVVDYYGPSDFVLRGKTQPERAYTAKSGSFALLGGIKNGKPSVETERFASPAAYVTRDDPPLLVFQGTVDKVVLPDQSERIVQLYKDAGLDVQYVALEDAGHGGPMFFIGRQHDKMVAFLKRVRSSK